MSIPSGPWVLVVGMHRSGTSALTGALGHLGLSLPAPHDLVVGHYDNPAHHESRALTDVADAVLSALGGSWSAPPPLPPGWERSPALDPLRPRAARAARTAFPGPGPLVWKDPRLCLLLPWWRSVLPSPVVPVLVWRDPLAVARSLRARQGFPLSLGLALWQRYNEAALDALAGRPAYVLRYEDLVADPRPSLESAARWLATEAGVAIDASDPALHRAAASVAQPSAGPGPGQPPGPLVGTASILAALHGAVAAVPGAAVPGAAVPGGAVPGAAADHGAPEPSAEPDWMDDVIEQRRQYEDLYARYMRYIRLRRRIPLLGRMERRRRR